jgi:hypothetical protein
VIIAKYIDMIIGRITEIGRGQWQSEGNHPSVQIMVEQKQHENVEYFN